MVENSVVAEQSPDPRLSQVVPAGLVVAGRDFPRSYLVGHCMAYVTGQICEGTKDSNTVNSGVLDRWNNRRIVEDLLMEVAEPVDGSEGTPEVWWQNDHGQWHGSARWTVQRREEMEVVNLLVLVTMGPILTQVLSERKKHREAAARGLEMLGERSFRPA